MHGRRRRLRWWWGCDKTLELCARVRLVSSSNNESDYSKTYAIKSGVIAGQVGEMADRLPLGEISCETRVRFAGQGWPGGEWKGWRLNFKVQPFWNGEWHNVYNVTTRSSFGMTLVNHDLTNCRCLCILRDAWNGSNLQIYLINFYEFLHLYFYILQKLELSTSVSFFWLIPTTIGMYTSIRFQNERYSFVGYSVKN